MQACDFESPHEESARKEKVRQERLAQEQAKRNEIIGALKKAYDADDSWDKGLGIKTWTVELQDRIVGRPIVSSGVLVDVWLGKDGKDHLHLIKSGVFGPRFDFFWTCPKPGRLAATGFPEYFFAAKVQSVQKEARYTPEDLMTGGLTTDGPRFILAGECLELRLNEEKIRLNQKEAEARKKMDEILKDAGQ